MTTLMVTFRNTLLLICLFLTIFCAATKINPEIVLVGSTPGDESIKSILSITGTNVDFIRWNLKLNGNNTFALDITYGESQPNTLGFKNNGQRQSIKGTYLITKNDNHTKFKETYQLSSSDLPENLSLVKITENLFHILTAQNKLMIGNGGWSYSLNRKMPIHSESVLISSSVSNDQSLRVVFDGRTPCQEFKVEHPEMKASQDCFKLKWQLILQKDSVTHLPTTCTIRNIVDNQPRNISGKWEIMKGTVTNPDAIIYKIMVDNLSEPILLLVGDDNVLFFVDKNNKPMRGNDDFSFALNKKL